MNTACMLEKTDKYTQCLSCPSWRLVCEGGDEAPDTDLLLCFPKVEEDQLKGSQETEVEGESLRNTMSIRA